jgi:arylsulfatase
MNRRQFISSTLAVPTISAATQGAERPNVILIMTDQHRMDAIGAYGNPVIRTPHLDALASGGARFTNCWTQHPVCMPSRASIFTGRYPSSHGVRSNGIRLPAHEKTLPQALREQGYTTFGAGKFHFIPHYPYRSPLPTMETHREPYYGFEEFHLGEDGRSGEHWQWVQKNHPQFHLKPDNEVPVEVHNSGWVANHTIDFLKRAAAGGKPFFAFASFVDPHHSYNPPAPYNTMYRERDMPPIVARAAEREAKPGYYQKLYESQRPMVERAAHHRTQYYGEVSLIDDCIGRITQTLDELKVRDNTMVVFTSDHGDLLGDHFLFYKGPYHYRNCAAVPLMANWPGRIRAGKVVDGIVQEIDVLPTILDLAGCPLPPGVQGRSQRAPLTTDSTDTGYDSALIQFGTSGVAQAGAPAFDGTIPDLWTLRTREWRLSYYPGQKTGELYNLGDDPDEFVNLWDRRGMESARGLLKEQLLDRMLAAHDPLPPREKPY